jgi:hypothetical protein
MNTWDFGNPEEEMAPAEALPERSEHLWGDISTDQGEHIALGDNKYACFSRPQLPQYPTCDKLESFWCQKGTALVPTLLVMGVLLLVRAFIELLLWALPVQPPSPQGKVRANFVAVATKEIAILACMAFAAILVPSVWSIKQILLGSQATYFYSFEFLHAYLLFVAVFHCCATFVVGMVWVYVPRLWGSYEKMTLAQLESEFHHDDDNYFWPHCSTFRKVQYNLLRARFIRSRNLPPPFNFAVYLTRYFGFDLPGLGAFGLYSWLLLLLLLGACYVLATRISCIWLVAIGVLWFVFALFLLAESYFMLYRLTQQAGYVSRDDLKSRLFGLLRKEIEIQESSRRESALVELEAEEVEEEAEFDVAIQDQGVEMIERQLHEHYRTTNPEQLVATARLLLQQENQQAREQAMWLKQRKQHKRTYSGTRQIVETRSSAAELSAIQADVLAAQAAPEAVMWRPRTWSGAVDRETPGRINLEEYSSSKHEVITREMERQFEGEDVEEEVVEVELSEEEREEAVRLQQIQEQLQQQEELLRSRSRPSPSNRGARRQYVVAESPSHQTSQTAKEMSTILMGSSVMQLGDAVDTTVFYVDKWYFAFDGGLSTLSFFFCFYLALLVPYFLSPCSSCEVTPVFFVLPFVLCALFLFVVLPLLIGNCGLLFAATATNRSLYSDSMAHFQRDEALAHFVQTKLRQVDIAQLFEAYDERKTGRISVEGFQLGIQECSVYFDEGDFKKAVQLLDPNTTGFVERHTLYEFTLSGQIRRRMGRNQRFDEYTEAVQLKLDALSRSVAQLNGLLHQQGS